MEEVVVPGIEKRMIPKIEGLEELIGGLSQQIAYWEGELSDSVEYRNSAWGHDSYRDRIRNLKAAVGVIGKIREAQS